MERFFKNNEYPWNLQPRVAVVVKFEGEHDIQKLRSWLESHNAKIENILTRKEAVKNYQKLIDVGSLKNRVASSTELGAFKDDWGRWNVKWTAEDAAKTLGAWEEDDIAWLRIDRGDDFVYQLILKENDYVAFLPGKKEKFVNLGQSIILPYCSDWEEFSGDEITEIIQSEEHIGALGE